MTDGWVKIHRKILDKGWYKKSEYVHLWLHIILSASHKGREEFWNGSIIKLKEGQFITGRQKMAEKTGISESGVQRILKVFENEQQIEQQTTSTSRLITVKNWSDYQNTEHRSEQRVNSGRTASEQRLNTIQECKELKNEKIKEFNNKFSKKTVDKSVDKNQLRIDKGMEALKDVLKNKGIIKYD